jgi:hypothetical protein
MSPNLSRWLLATLVFVALGLLVSRQGMATARWVMLGLLMLVFFFGGTSARRASSPSEPEAPGDASRDAVGADNDSGEDEEDSQAAS